MDRKEYQKKYREKNIEYLNDPRFLFGNKQK